MKLDTKTLSGFFGDFKTIWFGVVLMVTGAAWAGDTRWLTLADASIIVVQIELTNMQQRVEELEIEKIYVDDPKKLKMIDALINIKKSKMDALIKKHSLIQ